MYSRLYSIVVRAHISFNPIVYSLILALIMLISSVENVEVAAVPAGGSGGTGT